MSKFLTRRRFLIGSTLGASALTLSGCDLFDQNDKVAGVIRSAETLTMTAQRLLQGRDALAREFTEADISPSFRVNGTSAPDSEEYAELLEAKFASWRLKVDGLVERPREFSLADLKALPARTQITRHDCVEGWSAIGKWTGVPLASLLRLTGLKPTARFVVLHCADELEKTLDGSGRYYESIDLIDAVHPQTILAYQMNDQDLTVGHGAPLRLRVERQLGYKSAKYLMRIELVDSFAGLWAETAGIGKTADTSGTRVSENSKQDGVARMSRRRVEKITPISATSPTALVDIGQTNSIFTDPDGRWVAKRQSDISAGLERRRIDTRRSSFDKSGFNKGGFDLGSVSAEPPEDPIVRKGQGLTFSGESERIGQVNWGDETPFRKTHRLFVISDTQGFNKSLCPAIGRRRLRSHARDGVTFNAFEPKYRMQTKPDLQTILRDRRCYLDHQKARLCGNFYRSPPLLACLVA